MVFSLHLVIGSIPASSGSAGSKVKPDTVGIERGQKTYNCDIIGTLRFNCEGFFTVSFVFPQKFVQHGDQFRDQYQYLLI